MTVKVLDILTYPDPLLKQPTKPVENIGEELQQVIDNMAETMYTAPGVGLAATQVGFDQSVIVYDITHTQGEADLKVLINPKIIESEGSFLSENEGCLSVPDLRSDVKRAQKILVEGFDREGKPERFEADGFRALVLQHEIDHLNGVLFLDRISSLKREMYKRRIRKMMKNT